MSTRFHAAPRRTLHSGTIAALVAVVVGAVLAGCGASSSEYAAEPASGGDVAPQEAEAPAVADARYSGTEDGDPAQSPLSFRSVIVTGAMYITVEDPIVAADRAAGIVKNAGGRIDARNETAPDEDYGGSAALTLRIPSDGLDAVVDDLRELGTVDEFSTDSYDVTNEVTDLESRISTLRASTARIEALLLEATDIADIITLEDELDGRQAELESLEAHQRGLTDQVSMSTIELSLTTEPVVIVEDDDEPETFLDGLESGWSALVGFLSGVLVIVGVMLPWLALMALVALAVVVLLRARKSRTTRRAAESPQAAEPEPAKN